MSFETFMTALSGGILSEQEIADWEGYQKLSSVSFRGSPSDCYRSAHSARRAISAPRIGRKEVRTKTFSPMEEPLRYHRTFGLHAEQLDELEARIEDILPDPWIREPGGRRASRCGKRSW